MNKIMSIMLMITFIAAPVFAEGEGGLSFPDNEIDINKNNWDQIETCMTRSQVIAILGEPVSRKTTFEGEEWTYPKKGYVAFSKIPNAEDRGTEGENYQKNYTEPRVCFFSEPTNFYY